MVTPDEQGALARYEEALLPHRAAFDNRHALRMLGGAAEYPDIVRLFLIRFAASGIAMTQPVEGWIRRAGERCRALGYAELGDALVAHAAEEAGHHKLMAADLYALCRRWNAIHRRQIDPVALAYGGRTDAVRRYEELHEAIVAGDTPFAQVAVEHEIEALSVRYGPKLLAAGGLTGGQPGGQTGGDGLSFLRVHVAADVGHSAFNRLQLGRLLARHPETLPALVRAGAAALDVYGAFLDDCLAAALSAEPPEEGRAEGRTLDCALHPPPGPQPGPYTLPGWLADARALRSRILHDGGRRPAFAPRGGSFGDADPADFACWHFVLSDDGLPVGTIRVLPAPEEGTNGLSMTGRTFGSAEVDAALAREGLVRGDCVEASRLVLDAGYRRGATVRRLLAGAWAVAAESGARGILAAAGTCDRQDRMLALFGARPLAGVPVKRSERFGDDMRLMLFPVDPAAPPDYPEIAVMQGLVAARFAHVGRHDAAA